MQKTTVLIDGDILLYRVAAAAEEAVEFDTDVVAAWVDIRSAQQTIKSAIEDIVHSTATKIPVICLTSPNNFRKEILPTYKANRKGTRKPIGFGPLRKWIKKEYKTYEKDGLEADDLLGILATHPDLIKGHKVIYSQDKDLLQIPGFHFDFSLNSVVNITEEEGDYQHFFQTLTGDRVDNYIGCPTCGPKKAEKILKEKAGWNSIVSAFEKQGLSENDALVQAQVSRICRNTDYDFDKGEVLLWKP